MYELGNPIQEGSEGAVVYQETRYRAASRRAFVFWIRRPNTKERSKVEIVSDR